MRRRHTRETARIQRRFERWELDHLREHAAQLAGQVERLAAEIDDLKRQLAWAEDREERWHDDALQVMRDTGLLPGLTLNGQVVAVHV